MMGAEAKADVEADINNEVRVPRGLLAVLVMAYGCLLLHGCLGGCVTDS